jgi:hypothetical protein
LKKKNIFKIKARTPNPEKSKVEADAKYDRTSEQVFYLVYKNDDFSHKIKLYLYREIFFRNMIVPQNKFSFVSYKKGNNFCR